MERTPLYFTRTNEFHLMPLRISRPLMILLQEASSLRETSLRSSPGKFSKLFSSREMRVKLAIYVRILLVSRSFCDASGRSPTGNRYETTQRIQNGCNLIPFRVAWCISPALPSRLHGDLPIHISFHHKRPQQVAGHEQLEQERDFLFTVIGEHFCQFSGSLSNRRT